MTGRTSKGGKNTRRCRINKNNKKKKCNKQVAQLQVLSVGYSVSATSKFFSLKSKQLKFLLFQFETGLHESVVL
jgi:hypothetical protein